MPSPLRARNPEAPASPDGSELVARYAEAKSRQDVAAALGLCHEDFFLDTVAFGIRGRGKPAVTAQLEAFFSAFPDYHVTLEGTAAADGVVTAWGTVGATMRGSLGTFAPTGRGFNLPFVCLFPFHGGRLAGERFFFDLHTFCEQLGLPTAALAAELHALRDAPELRMPVELGRS